VLRATNACVIDRLRFMPEAPRIIGAKPRPRVLLVGFAEDENQTRRMLELFPTVRLVAGMGDVQGDEWDMVIQREGSLSLQDHMYGIGVGCSDYPTIVRSGDNRLRYFRFGYVGKGTIATEFRLNESLPGELFSLVTRQLGRLAQSREFNPELSMSFFSEQPGVEPGDEVVYLVWTAEPSILAALVNRRNGKSYLALPEGVTDVTSWARVMVSIWHRRDSTVFPSDPSWEGSPDWMSQDELAALRNLEEAESARQAKLDELDAIVEQNREALATARDEAMKGEQLLLRGGGDELVSQVIRSLERMGFIVQNRDDVNPPNDRLEDLWVTDDDDPSWIALVEVRSYAKGAQVSDLLRLSGRFANRFLQGQQRLPSRLWYVVNHFTNEDPSGRPQPLDTNPREVETFASDGGLVIGTKSLFLLVREIETGAVNESDARARLREHTGVFDYP
jgi:hypothetical protein